MAVYNLTFMHLATYGAFRLYIFLAKIPLNVISDVAKYWQSLDRDFKL